MLDESKPTHNVETGASPGIATLFLRNRHLLVLSVLVILVAGFSAFRSLPRLEDPVITNRNPQIVTVFPGASADRVEALVSEPIERSLKEIPEIKNIESTSLAGVSVVAIELADAVTPETNKAIFSEIRDRLNDATTEFPPAVLPPDFDDKRNAVAYTLIVALRWRDGSEESLGILSRQAEELADQLRNIPGTDLVRIYGEGDEEITVTLDNRELSGLGLSVESVASALRRADAKVPAGQLRGDESDILLEVNGALDSEERIRKTPLLQGKNGATVRLGDIARVERSIREPAPEIALSDGKRAVLVAARVSDEIRVDAWAGSAEKRVASFRETLGSGIEVETVFNQNGYTTARLGELAGNLLLGALVVFLVIFFSMGWRSSLIVSSALPLTAAMTLFVVALSGGKLHQMSIFGMIIALGLLIDNAIVVTDEIRKKLAHGLGALEAVRQSLKHLFVPLLSSTLTTMFAFLPILLLPGGAGDFVSSISSSVIIALGCSFLISMTLIAAFAGIFGKASKLEQRLPQWISQGVGSAKTASFFRKLLLFPVRRPLLGVALALVVPALGFVLAGTMGSQFFPRTDRDMFEVEMWLPTQSSTPHTRAVAAKADAILRARPEVRRVDWLIGGSFPSVYYNLIMDKDGSRNYAHAIVHAESADAVREMIDDLQRTLDQELPEAQTVVTKFAQGPPAAADVEIRLLGPSIPELQALGETVRGVLAAHPEILQTQVTIPRGEPKLWFDASEEDARLAGLQLTDLAEQLQNSLEGTRAGSVIEDVEELPVRIRFNDAQRQDVNAIATMNFVSDGTGGRWIPMSALGELKLRPELGQIARRNGVRTNSILGFAKPGTLPIDITNDVLAELDARGFELPPGYRIELGGESESQSEALGNLMLYLPVIVVLTISILILSFRNVGLAAILLVVAPLSVGFGLLATWVAQFPLSFNTIIGSLGLMGLAFNSSIIVLAGIRANPLARTGNPDAIVDVVLGAGRHLISTTLTTMGSFLPLLLLIGGQFWPPLAIVLAGGVGGSTLLAVLFTPAAYRLLERLRTYRWTGVRTTKEKLGKVSQQIGSIAGQAIC